MLKANVECQSEATNGLHVAGQAADGCPAVPYGCPYGGSEAVFGLHMAAQRLPVAAHGVHMAVQRLLLGVLGAAYGCSEAPNSCP